jgi:hypothetical protein
MRRALLVLVVLIVALAVLWAGAWYGASEFARAALDEAQAEAVAGRPGADCTNRRISGFPLTLSIACDETEVVAPVRGVAARIAGLVAEAPFYRPGFVTTALSSPLTLEGPGDIRAEATWQDATATARAGLFPMGVKQTSGAVENLELRLTGLPVDAVTAERGTAALGSSPAVANSLRADVTFDALRVNRPGSAELPEATGAARIDLVDAGGTVTNELDDQLRQWFANGGKVVVDHATVTVSGVEFSASGNLEVGTGGRVSGDLAVSLVGIDRLPDLAETLRPGSREKASQVAGVLMAISEPVETTDGPSQKLTSTVSIRDGVVILGFIPLFRLPSVFEMSGMAAASAD